MTFIIGKENVLSTHCIYVLLVILKTNNIVWLKVVNSLLFELENQWGNIGSSDTFVAVTWFRELIAGLLPRKPGFDHKHVVLVLYKVALEQLIYK
jgi:hypothetical protein